MIELASVIRDLRAELAQAISEAEGEALRFELGPIELEVAVELERGGNAGAKVRFWVVESGAEGKVSSQSTQRIKLSLQPTLAGSGEPPFVHGAADGHEQ
ncbi:trypco2 family protein [Streptomyces sp. NPDC093707]|uniref:trypco2 family protein n=1 Tax=Streptomyces sp. NPDC093707 TaxID=3154984 RepID=UPI00344BD608